MRDLARRPATALARVLVAVGLALAATGPAAGQGNAVAQEAVFVTVPSPLTSEAVEGIAKRVAKAREATDGRRVQKIVFDFNPDNKDAATPDFGVCYSLADQIARLQAEFQTIGFVHGKVSAHAVLPVLACQEVVMSRDARLGPVAGDGVPVGDVERAAYRKILGDSRGRLWAAVEKLYLPGLRLGAGSKNGAKWFVDLDKKADATAAGVVGIGPDPVPFGVGGQAASYDARAARDIGLAAAAAAEDRVELADLYGIAPSSVRDGPLGGRAPVPFHYVLEKTREVDGAMRESLNRVITDMKRRKGNVLFLEIQCGGGDPDAGRALADDLRKHQTGDDAVQIVAFIPDQAPGGATFLALGCSEIVMSRRKDAADPANPGDPGEATLGDFSALLKKGGKDAANADLFRKSLRELADHQGYPVLLADGMFDRDLEIVRARSAVDRNRRKLMTKADLDADAGKNWVLDATVKPKGQLLLLNATRAYELGVARQVVDNRDVREVYAAYGVRVGDVREAQPSWLDRFAEFVKQPVVTFLLVLVGFVGLILELKVPGLTVPGITAALCFVLVFWANSQYSGEMFVLALLLFLLGLVLVALEIFVLPGFGAPGVVGVLCMLGGLGLVTVDRVPDLNDAGGWVDLGSKMGQYLFAMVGAVGAAVFIARFLPNIPMANRLLLSPPVEGADGAGERVLPGADTAAALLGAVGTANTALRPAGVVRFGDAFVDVVSEGGYIPPGARVQCVEVEGTRVVVKEI